MLTVMCGKNLGLQRALKCESGAVRVLVPVLEHEEKY